tara:strand:- start:98 stop:535 length:438 start_codon:yes stop_codon:yes gene_type:complete
METNEIANKLFLECNLNMEEDIFRKKFTNGEYTIIKRTGIEKIISHLGINIRYRIITSEPKFASVHAIGEYGDIKMQTTGSASPQNCQNTYYLEMAEKRAMARLVIKLTRLANYDVKSEDEHIDFTGKKIISKENIEEKLGFLNS